MEKKEKKAENMKIMKMHLKMMKKKEEEKDANVQLKKAHYYAYDLSSKVI